MSKTCRLPKGRTQRRGGERSHAGGTEDGRSEAHSQDQHVLHRPALPRAYAAAAAADVVAVKGPIETIPFNTFSDYADDVWTRVEAVGTAQHPLVTSKSRLSVRFPWLDRAVSLLPLFKLV